VAPGDRDVVEEDVAVGVAADLRDVGVEEELAAGVRPPLHDQDAAPALELLGSDVDLGVELGLHVGGHERDGGVRPRLGERSPARRAEVGAFGVLVAAVRAEHAGDPIGEL
jgi:hypothetical protein